METESTVDPFTGDIINKYMFPSIINQNLGRSVIRIGKRTKGYKPGAELIVIPAVVEVGADRVEFQTGKSITPADFARAATQDDNPYKYVYGYQLVRNTETGKPLMIQTNPRYAPDYVYKIVNLYGDGRFTTEYPGFPVKSELENGTIKVKQEFTDDEVLALLKGQTIRQSVAETPVVETPTVTPGSFEELRPEDPSVDPFAAPQEAPTLSQQSASQPKGQKVKDGIYVNQEALTKEEQMELFNYLKPYLESQASKTNKGANASKMIGLGLRWDYKVNNPGKEAMNIPDVINPLNKNKYGYYDTSINGQPLAPINDRFRELMEKATGVDMTHYDGAIINLYDSTSFISSHNDVDESKSAIDYPVIGINLGGTGNFAIESRDGDPKNLLLKDGSGYVFGLDGANREVFHRTFPTAQNSFLPALTTQLDGKTYEPGSYRVTITMRRVMPLEPGMPTKPAIKTTQETAAQPTVTQTVGESIEKIVTAPGYIKDSAKKHLAKELFKIRQATQFIGTGGGNDSTTTRMENAYSQVGAANTGVYSANDLIYVSSNGNRGNRFVNVKDDILQGAYTLIDKAIAANARFIMDTKSHLDATSGYNVGEVAMADYLTKKGYVREDATGIWSPAETPTANTVEYGGKKFIIEGSLELGNGEIFFTKNDGSKGAELTNDKPLYRKVTVAAYAQENPGSVAELTELQGSPKYLLTITDEIVSLNPTSYGDTITSSDIINRVVDKLQERSKAGSEQVNKELPALGEQGVEVGEVKPTFSYKGKTIETAFDLTEGQVNALQELSDFAENDKDKFITLQGPAGTGKTSVIGYLQNYLGGKYKFIYMAPTHAATAELAFATVNTGNKELPMTVASSFSTRSNGGIVSTTMTKKLLKKLALRNNIIVIDEVSMLGANTMEIVKGAIAGENVKIIFMGDISQIPEVDDRNPAVKQVSKAFSEFKQVKLTEVKRTSNNDILEVLTAIRNNINNKIPKVDNTDALKYLKVSEFNRQLADSVEKNPEETMLIAYTKNAVAEYNKKIRQELGRTGDLQKDDVIMGYLGYASKQIENGDIANSIQYTVTDVQKDGSIYKITATSKKLNDLREKGVKNISEYFTTGYHQLGPNDIFTFSDITSADMNANNEKVSKLMKTVYDAKAKAIASGASFAWVKFYEIVDGVSREMSKIDLGADYIYDPSTNRMERYSADKYFQFKKQFGEIYVEKGIDLGHATTIHKSQGSTIKNVFFDANSLPKGSSSKLYNGDTLIGTEKQSLIYVGMSRTSNLLAVSDDISENFYNLKTYDPNAATVNEQSYELADGNIYKASEITVEMMEKMGYSNDLIGTFFKQLNRC
jgi:alkylated DNA repair dioxygenase AlkB